MFLDCIVITLLQFRLGYIGYWVVPQGYSICKKNFSYSISN